MGRAAFGNNDFRRSPVNVAVVTFHARPSRFQVREMPVLVRDMLGVATEILNMQQRQDSTVW